MNPANFEPEYWLEQYDAVNETHTRYSLTSQRPDRGARRFLVGSLVITDIEAHRLAFELGAVLKLQQENVARFEAIDEAFNKVSLNHSTLPDEALERVS